MPFPLIAIVVAVVRVAAPVVIKVAIQAAKQAPKVGKVAAKQLPQATKQAVKKTGPKKGNTSVNKYRDKAKKKEKKKKDPCADYKKNRKKRKYVVYKADEYDAAGNKIGTYVGRTSGAPGESTRSIINRRQLGHHRNVKNLQPLFESDSYPAVRGAEEIYQKSIGTSKQINPISPKNARKNDYEECAKSKGAS